MWSFSLFYFGGSIPNRSAQLRKTVLLHADDEIENDNHPYAGLVVGEITTCHGESQV